MHEPLGTIRRFAAKTVRTLKSIKINRFKEAAMKNETGYLVQYLPWPCAKVRERMGTTVVTLL